MSHRHEKQIPLVVVGTYVVGYLAGRSIAVLWTRGPAHEHGVRRLVGGVAHRPVPEQPSQRHAA